MRYGTTHPYIILQEVLEIKEAKVIVNVAYSHDIVRNTTYNVALQFNWSEKDKVNWRHAFLIIG